MTSFSSDVLVHPVILCGGSGTRLWPLSTSAIPKPFLPLMGEQTLFEETLARVMPAAGFAAPIIVAGRQHRALIEAHFAAHLAPADYSLIVEPAARSTAPAIALAAALLDPSAMMLVCPSDHYIADLPAFHRAVSAACALAQEDRLVAFGIAPDRPETGYGYVRQGAPLAGGYEIAEFVEKPNLARAEAYLASGEYSWNGGIFVFRSGVLLAELGRHRPQMIEQVEAALSQSAREGAATLPAAEPFSKIVGESIDHAVMENTRRAAIVPVEMGWSDIGTWAALHDALPANGAFRSDTEGNHVSGNADLVDCRGVFALSDGPRISAIGLEDISIVVHGAEVLVTTREGAQLVGQLPGAQKS